MASSGVMASLGIWSCQYRELRPINFGGSGATQTGEGTSGGEGGGADEEQGFSKGRGRGRGRDGGGEYEMVGMKLEGSAK